MHANNSECYVPCSKWMSSSLSIVSQVGGNNSRHTIIVGYGTAKQAISNFIGGRRRSWGWTLDLRWNDPQVIYDLVNSNYQQVEFTIIR